MQYIIIGGDAAGMSAASRLKRRMPESNVMVLEKTKDVSYSACGMPYNISEKDKSTDNLVVRTAEVFRNKQGIDLKTGYTVKQIDKTKKKVVGIDNKGSKFEYFYDKLLIATGARAILPDVPGNDLEGVFVLKTLSDCRKIKKFIEEKNIQSAVIVGMGYIALEMAESFVKRGIKVEMVKARKQLLPWMLPELSNIVGEELSDKGVNFYPGLPLLAIEKTDTNLKVTADSKILNCDIVLLAIGVMPESELAKDIKLDIGPAGAISIDDTMRTSDPDIFAAGDCADCRHIVTGQKTWIPLALNANRGGRIAADNMIGVESLFKGSAGTGVFKVFDLEVARTGLSVKEAEKAGFDPIFKEITSKSKAHVYPGAEKITLALIADKKTHKILGAQMVGKEGVARRINAVSVALQAGMSLDDFAECDLAYAPPFGPVWDPLLTAASVLISLLNKNN